ncbi:hypothetical protein H6F75_21810 [Nodosilinea sp. FACHB-131]|nr:hypothetical protein [Nodosilinea sp. FACHB-131]
MCRSLDLEIPAGAFPYANSSGCYSRALAIWIAV